jgi:hypothetical protein
MAGSGEDPGKQFEASAGRPIQDTDISKSLCGCSRDGGEGAVLDEQVLILHDGHEQFGVERRPAYQRVVDFFFGLGRVSDNRPRFADRDQRFLLTSPLL